jgi:hypothetical protein
VLVRNKGWFRVRLFAFALVIAVTGVAPDETLGTDAGPNPARSESGGAAGEPSPHRAVDTALKRLLRHPTAVPMRGLVYDGLKRRNRARNGCADAFAAELVDGSSLCTHGPDAAPEGVDVRERRRTRDLMVATSTADSSLPCYGDGVSGPRVQAVFARAQDVADRSSSVVPMITSWAARADAAFNASAAQTGGTRHVRWVTKPGCVLDVMTVVVSPSGDDTLTSLINELKVQGLNRTDRKYLVWTDATRYCGISEIKSDDTPSASNVHNFGPMFGRIDSACWGDAYSTEAHELMHMLGGIQLSAPHSSGAWHCTDESDRMCNPDEGGRSLSFPCSSANEPLFDCGNDDYFSTAPAPGSYLAAHWNAANNVFLSPHQPDGWCSGDAAAQSTQRKRRRGRRRGVRISPQPIPIPAPSCVS